MDMFLKSFEKIAVMASMISPEEYYELVHEKDPYIGALGGAAAGAAIGAKKGKPGSRAKAALIGAALGGTGGAAAGHQIGKALKHYQAHRIRKAVTNLSLRSTPARQHFANPSENES